MTIERKNGDTLGEFQDIRKRGEPDPNNPLSSVPISEINKEIERRQKVYPFVQFADLVIERGKEFGIEILPEKMLYELHYDCLGRPEMYVGYNLSEMTLEEITAEDEKINRGKLPPRTPGDARAVWTPRLVVAGGVVASYYDANSIALKDRAIFDFVISIRDKKE